MITFLYNVSSYMQLAGSMIILVICLSRFSIRSPVIRVMAIYAGTSIIFSLVQYLVTVYPVEGGINIVGNIYTITEAIIIGALYYLSFEITRFKYAVLSLLTAYLAFYFFMFILAEHRFYSMIRFGRDFLMIIMALTYFYYLLKQLPERELLKLPMFWINSSVIFFFSGTFILSIMRDYIIYGLNESYAGFYAFRNFFRFAFCLVLAYAAWLEWRSNPNRPSNSTSSSSSSLS